MKKTFVALAVLGAFAGSAMAADVTLYGRVDTGLTFTRTDIDGVKTNKSEMDTGFNTGSRWGIKGGEDLGNGWKVGFVLENQFTSDDGQLKTSSTLFDRESSLAVTKDGIGTLTFGRIGSLRGATSTVGWTGAYSPFSTGWGDYVFGTSKTAGNAGIKANNAIAFQSASFGGLQIGAEYSFANTAEGTTADKDDRYMAIGARYVAGPVNVMALFDMTNLSQTKDADRDDPMAFTLGATYDFGVAKVYGMATYFKDSDPIEAVTKKTTWNKDDNGNILSVKVRGVMDTAYDGYGLHLAVSAPVLGGTAMLGTNYYDAEVSHEEGADGSGKCDITFWSLSAGYRYDLSKRTYTYIGAGYVDEEVKHGPWDIKDSAYQVGFGLVHLF